MLKKLLLLTVVFTGFNVCNVAAMNNQNQLLHTIIQQGNIKQKSILHTLSTEAQCAGTAMGCCALSTAVGIGILHCVPKNSHPVIQWIPRIALGIGCSIAGDTLTDTIIMNATNNHKVSTWVGGMTGMALVVYLNHLNSNK